MKHILDHLAGRDAATIRAAREAALADEGGVAFDKTLLGAGAPPRPAKPIPVRWHSRRAA
jgi:indolepyruvate ferredoxin oxidoreductase beta subunit